MNCIMRKSAVFTAIVVLTAMVGQPRSCQAQQEFGWERGWYADGTSDWYTVRDGDRVLMSTATLRPDSTIAGLVFELDLSDPDTARSRPYGSDTAWTIFELTFDGSDTFLIDGTAFTRAPATNQVDDYDFLEDRPANRYGLMFLIDRLEQNGESLPDW
jgi:hypothetical protein